MTVNYEIGKVRKDKKMRITIILCVGNTKKRIKTGFFVTQADLNRKGKVRNDSPVYKKIREAAFKVEKEYSALDTFLTGETLSASDAMDLMRRSTIPTFFEYAREWMSKATMRGKVNYQTAINSFRAFVKKDIPFSMFSHGLLKDYLFTLKDTSQAKTLYMVCIRRIYKDAEKDYDIRPFSSFKLDIPTQQKRRSRAIDIETIRKVFTYDGKYKSAQLARDCAMMSFCLCGTNSVDLFYAPPIKGNIFAYDRTKTKSRRIDDAHIEIDIHPRITDLIRKYKGTAHAFVFFNKYSNYDVFNRAVNLGLKKLQEELGLEKFTFYAFRHSWATIARNDLRIDKWTVHEALNHSGDNTAIDDIYIKKDFRNINEANRKVIDYVFAGM